jgi:signal peptidase
MHLVLRIVKRAAAAAAILAVAAVCLLTLGPKLLPYQAFYVRSGSMTPTIEVGALAFYTPADASNLHPGDVIVFHRPDAPKSSDSLVTHRIVKVEPTAHGKVFVTKGDANAAPDPWRVPATGSGWRFRGSIPVVGYVIGALGSHLGHTWVLALASLLLGGYLLADIWRRPDTAPTPGSGVAAA